jgi:transposase
MGQVFIACDREQSFLMPPDVREWLPENHLAWFVLAAVEEMDVEAFYAAYRRDGRSRPAYEPSMMVALLLYAYARGVRSSRVIERACVEDVAFRVVAAQQRPDHATIARFIERHETALAGLFGEVLLLCARSGLAKVGVIAIDGTKVQANASRDANVDYEQLAREIIEEAKAIDAAEDELYGDRRGDELPEELSTSQGRRGWLREAKRRLEAERDRSPQPVPRSRPKRVKEAKRRLEGGTVDRVPGQRGLRALPHRTHERRAALQSRARSLHLAEHPAGAHQYHRSGLARGQGAARVHPGLQRPGRHERAPDRPGRRGDDRRR